jgi:hypothetical protein
MGFVGMLHTLGGAGVGIVVGVGRQGFLLKGAQIVKLAPLQVGIGRCEVLPL